MKNLRLKVFMIFILIGIFSFTTGTGVNAVLQSNGGTPATKTLDSWIVATRGMEAAGGTLGFSETINNTGLLATTTSNGLDCHMEKNTEYGALVLLSASSYGNPNPISVATEEKPYENTTTGNASGVIMNINKEWVAAGAGLTGTTYAKNANSRYINNDYTTTAGEIYHVGDAMDIGKWHGGTDNWRFFNTNVSGLLRAYAGSIFSYYGRGDTTNANGHIEKKWASRAVIVIGAGL